MDGRKIPNPLLGFALTVSIFSFMFMIIGVVLLVQTDFQNEPPEEMIPRTVFSVIAIITGFSYLIWALKKTLLHKMKYYRYEREVPLEFIDRKELEFNIMYQKYNNINSFNVVSRRLKKSTVSSIVWSSIFIVIGLGVFIGLGYDVLGIAGFISLPIILIISIVAMFLVYPSEPLIKATGKTMNITGGHPNKVYRELISTMRWFNLAKLPIRCILAVEPGLSGGAIENTGRSQGHYFAETDPIFKGKNNPIPGYLFLIGGIIALTLSYVQGMFAVGELYGLGGAIIAYIFGMSFLAKSICALSVIKFRSTVALCRLNGEYYRSAVQVGHSMTDSLHSERLNVLSDFQAKCYAAEVESETDYFDLRRSVKETRAPTRVAKLLEDICHRMSLVKKPALEMDVPTLDSSDAMNMQLANVMIGQIKDQISPSPPPPIAINAPSMERPPQLTFSREQSSSPTNTESPSCVYCRTQMTFNRRKGRWYCDRCDTFMPRDFQGLSTTRMPSSPQERGTYQHTPERPNSQPYHGNFPPPKPMSLDDDDWHFT